MNFSLAGNEEFIKKLTELIQENLGDEQLTGKEQLAKKAPLFRNKLWLWAVMALIILILGWFSINMIKRRI
jgi:hypothetical protein